MSEHRLVAGLDSHDPRDPNPWTALLLDRALPFDEAAKLALLKSNDSRTRRFLLPVLRPFILLFFVLVHLLRTLLPTWPHMPRTLHWLIYWGLKTFATPEANFLILRHFNIGTELLAFIRANAPVDSISSHPLKPTDLTDMKDNLFLQHDLNIYNFIIELNRGLRDSGHELRPPPRLDFSAISDSPFPLQDFPRRWTNCIDVQTLIELYTPVYALFLSRRDFVRAANSLQLDETVALYVARVLGSDFHMSLVNNHHPMVPLSTFQAGFRLMMHGYDAEALHAYLRQLKRLQAETGENMPAELRDGVTAA